MDPRVTEFQCIMPIGNTPSVLQHGILSHEVSSKLPHHSVAMQAVQDLRDVKRVPGGLKLHQYANLYFHARNPMMYLRKDHASHICVLRVSCEVLTVHGVVLADQNAASNYVRFLAPSQISAIDMDMVYAQDWRDQDRFAYFRKKAAKCAEVLVPQKVEPRLLLGAHVVDVDAQFALQQLHFSLPITITPGLFFR